MKKFIIAVMMMVFSSIAMADRVDQLNQWPVEQYCMQVTNFFKDGMEARRDGYARHIKQLPAEYAELLEHHQPLPHDSMWNMGWDKLNDREQDFMRKYVFEGWDAADEIIKAKKEVDSEAIGRYSQTFYEGCVAKRSAELRGPKTRINYIPVASSEHIGKHSPEVCKEIHFDVEVIAGAIEDGVAESQLADFAKRSQKQGDLSQERLDRILKQIKEAYEWALTKPMDEWMLEQVKDCD